MRLFKSSVVLLVTLMSHSVFAAQIPVGDIVPAEISVVLHTTQAASPVSCSTSYTLACKDRCVAQGLLNEARCFSNGAKMCVCSTNGGAVVEITNDT